MKIVNKKSTKLRNKIRENLSISKTYDLYQQARSGEILRIIVKPCIMSIKI